MCSLPNDSSRSGSPLALIIDGDADARHALSERLQAEGISADLVADAREAVEWLRFNATRYGIVLLDVGPITPGSMALLTWLRTVHPGLPTAVLTGPTDVVPLDSARLFLTVPTLRKPLSRSDLRVAQGMMEEHFGRRSIEVFDTSSLQAA